MEYRKLGKTGISVSIISLGTVELGMDYGINVPDDFGKPDEKEAIEIIQRAYDCGINLFDTAPAYGNSEDILGKALKNSKECYIATKVSIPKDENENVLSGIRLKNSIQKSLRNSLNKFNRDVLDIVQIHNATEEIINNSDMIEILTREKEKGNLRFLGVSIYDEKSAISAINHQNIDIVQVPYNILDQKMEKKVFKEAEHHEVGILVRSVFLKGALTSKAQYLPDQLHELKSAVEKLKRIFNVSWEELPEIALRFCISSPMVSSALVGVRTHEELDKALQSFERGMLSWKLIEYAKELSLDNDNIVNPTRWSIV